MQKKENNKLLRGIVFEIEVILLMVIIISMLVLGVYYFISPYIQDAIPVDPIFYANVAYVDISLLCVVVTSHIWRKRLIKRLSEPRKD